MAADLGTWPAEQATVLLEVLHTAGLHPKAQRTRGEVHVTVPDEEGDRAHATLVAQMDTIAKAARPARPARGAGPPRTRRLRAVESPEPTGRAAKPSRGRAAGGPKRAGVSRPASGGRAAAPAAIAVTGFAAAFAAPVIGTSPTFPLVVMTGALVWVLGKRAQRGV